MATPTQITDPRQAIADAFSQFNVGPSSGPSSDQIAGLFAPLLGDVQSEQAPLPRPITQGLNPLQAFAGALASNVGSALTRNPMFAQNFARTIAEQQQRQQAVEDQNYLEDLAFNKEKRNRLLTIRASAMEKQIENLMQQGKDQDAANLAGKLEKLRGQVEMAVNEAKLPGEMALQKLRNQGDIATAQARSPQEKEADKDIAAIMDQYGVSESTARTMKMSGNMRNVAKQVTYTDPITKQPVTRIEMNPTPFATESQVNDWIDTKPEVARAIASGNFPDQVPDDPQLRMRLRARAVQKSKVPTAAQAQRE